MRKFAIRHHQKDGTKGRPAARNVRSTIVALLAISAAVVLSVSAKPAGASVYSCSGWIYIQAANSGWWHATASDPNVDAIGDRNLDPWNQQFSICHDSAWDASHFALRSNASGAYLEPLGDFQQLFGLSFSVTHGEQLFRWCDYDGNFSTFQSVGTGRFVGADLSFDWAPVRANSTTLTGWQLFRVDGKRPPYRCNT